MKNVFNKTLMGLFALSAVFEVQNSLPPTPERSIANSLPPCIEAPAQKMANTLPPTWDSPVKVLANSLLPVPEYGRMHGRC